MPISPQQRDRLDRRMNDRRLALDLTWREVAAAAGISYEALRKLRLGHGGVRDLTGAKVSRGLRWTPGSVAAVIAGGEPEELADIPLVPGGAQCSVEEFLLGPEAAEMVSDESRLQLIRAHRGEDPDGRVVRPAHVGCLPLAPEGRRQDAG